MRKQLLITTLAILMVLGLAVNAKAEVVDLTGSVSATAEVGGVTTLSITPAEIIFGTTDVDAFPTTPANKKIVITYTSNYNPWKMAIYTNNVQVPSYDDNGTPADPSDDTGRYAKGGLATANGENVAPCKWVCQDDAPAAPAIGTIGSYNFIKDIRDEDDLATGADDESWGTAFADGYANIAFGGPDYGWCVDPTNSPDYTGDAADGTIAVYVAGLFGTYPPTAGTYTSNIYFDLYHE